mmetsp:Transcript_30138/g.70122  ORF Transcript_30138/g.70122 Transcript_30138/m.70122 type:complete len:303 (+) Transcript_30138:430-1338(+)
MNVSPEGSTRTSLEPPCPRWNCAEELWAARKSGATQASQGTMLTARGLPAACASLPQQALAAQALLAFAMTTAARSARPGARSWAWAAVPGLLSGRCVVVNAQVQVPTAAARVGVRVHALETAPALVMVPAPARAPAQARLLARVRLRAPVRRGGSAVGCCAHYHGGPRGASWRSVSGLPASRGAFGGPLRQPAGRPPHGCGDPQRHARSRLEGRPPPRSSRPCFDAAGPAFCPANHSATLPFASGRDPSCAGWAAYPAAPQAVCGRPCPSRSCFEVSLARVLDEPQVLQGPLVLVGQQKLV